jgi:hypothetical protein
MPTVSVRCVYADGVCAKRVTILCIVFVFNNGVSDLRRSKLLCVVSQGSRKSLNVQICSDLLFQVTSCTVFALLQV